MDKLKRSFKHLLAPAIVLLLVAIMGVFSPIVSVAAALRLNPMDEGSIGDGKEYTIQNVPTRTVEVNTKVPVPTIGGKKDGVVLIHANQKTTFGESNVSDKNIHTESEYEYEEIGQYEWRFYTTGSNGTSGKLFNTYTVTVTDTTYAMTMPDNVYKVAPIDTPTLDLPLPASYKVGGETVKLAENGINGVVPEKKDEPRYATLKLKDHKTKEGDDKDYDYVLRAKASLGNYPVANDNITIDQNGVHIKLSGEDAGNLKVTYYLYDKENKNILVAVPLSNIEIKNIKKGEVTFTSIPSAPSVKNLAYYNSVALTAPSADSAKYGSTSFSVEADTKIVKIQAHLYSTEPNDWNKAKHQLTVEKDANGKWVIKEDGKDTENKYLEISGNGLTVKIKKLGWYRFQFETSTLFGYKMDDDFKFDNTNAEAGKDNGSVKYWSDSIRIYRDSTEPNFAWVGEYSPYDEDGNVIENNIADMNENFDDYLDKYTKYLPMTEKPEATDTKVIKINPKDGLVLPAIFPHDNATSFAEMSVKAFNVDQIQDENGKSVSGENYVWSTDVVDDNTSKKLYFKYDHTKHVQISFVADSERSSSQNRIQMENRDGLYRVRVEVEEKEPIFEDEGKGYSNGYANTRTKYLYFYVDSNYTAINDSNNNNGKDVVSPVIDENKIFQVSDVYLWEGYTFDFAKPTVSDANTPTNDLQTAYYLIGRKSTGNTLEVISKLDFNVNATRVTVDLKNLYKYDAGTDENSKTTKLNFDVDCKDYTGFSIYAVARNFNAMQANLKNEMRVNMPNSDDADKGDEAKGQEGVAGVAESGVISDKTYFRTALFQSEQDQVVKQYGYAWKYTDFKIYAAAETNAVTAKIEVTMSEAENSVNKKNGLSANKSVEVTSIKVNWTKGTGSTAETVDGQLSAAVYQVKANNVLVPHDLKNEDKSSADIISSVAYKASEYQVGPWYFTPKVGGDYILVVTAKNNADSKVYTYVKEIKIGSSGEWNWGDLNTSADNNYTIDATVALGESLSLPTRDLSRDNKAVYYAKNRTLYAYKEDGEVDNSKEAGYYTITVLNKNDANCITGNKFVPNQSGVYRLQFRFFVKGSNSAADQEILVKNYNIQVNNETSGVTSIRMGESYKDTTVLWNADHSKADEEADKVNLTTQDDEDDDDDDDNKPVEATTYTIDGQKYTLDAKYTDKNPAYALVLPEFIEANYGAATDFVVDSTFLYKYLEPIYENNKITGYRYPAIAIPMPNVVTDTTSSDEVEITVQKSGNSNYMVSTKKLNAGGKSDTASEIAPIEDYYVFRPTGTFKTSCKGDKYNEKTYMQTAVSTSNATGVYVINYKTSSTSVTFNVTIGNLDNGELSWNKNFVTYNNDDGKGDQEITNTGSTNNVVIEKVNGHRYVTIDMSKVYFKGNEDMENLIAEGPNPGTESTIIQSRLANEYYWENVTVWVQFEGTEFIKYNDWSETSETAIKDYKENEKYIKKFDLTNGSGTYKINISMPNKYTNTTVSASIEFTIDVDVSNKNMDFSKVWGIILIVLSLGLLAGVVYYFVKTARATRFIDVPRAAKDKGKGKNKTPKAVEAPKEDAK